VITAVVSSGGGAPTLDDFQSAIAVVVGVAVLGLAIAASALALPARQPELAEAEV
jgi:hypothetical protein